MNQNTKRIVVLGILIACQVLAGRFLTISTLLVKIGFVFLPIAISAILYGPIWAGIGAAVGDVVVAMLLPYGYFPPLTVSAFMTGAMYGLFLYRKPMSIWRIICCVLVINIVISVLLQTYLLTLLTGKGYLVLLPTRLVQNAIMTPIQILCIRLIAYPAAQIELNQAAKQPQP